MAKKTMKTKARKLNPVTGNVHWVDDLQLQVHPDHRVGPWDQEEPEYPEGYDPYHGFSLDGVSY